jgi:hypothetical protein
MDTGKILCRTSFVERNNLEEIMDGSYLQYYPEFVVPLEEGN